MIGYPKIKKIISLTAKQQNTPRRYHLTSNDLRIRPLERSHSLWIRYKNELSLNWTKIHYVFKLCLLSILLKRYRFSHFYCRKYIDESFKIHPIKRIGVKYERGFESSKSGHVDMISFESFSVWKRKTDVIRPYWIYLPLSRLQWRKY